MEYLDCVVLVLDFGEVVFELDVVVNGAANVRSQERKELGTGEQRLVEASVQEFVMAFYYCLEVLSLLQLCSQLEPVPLDDFLTQIVDEPFQEG